MVGERELDRVALEDSLAVELSAAKQRAHEPQVVGPRRRHPGAARVELGLLGHRELGHRERAVGHARMDQHQPLEQRLRGDERRVHHSERTEDVLLAVAVEILAADFFGDVDEILRALSANPTARTT